jgi:hypothetical protein
VDVRCEERVRDIYVPFFHIIDLEGFECLYILIVSIPTWYYSLQPVVALTSTGCTDCGVSKV